MLEEIPGSLQLAWTVKVLLEPSRGTKGVQCKQITKEGAVRPKPGNVLPYCHKGLLRKRLKGLNREDLEVHPGDTRGEYLYYQLRLAVKYLKSSPMAQREQNTRMPWG